MTRGRELVNDAVRLLRRRGFEPHVQANGGKHAKVTWSNGGRRQTLVISRSPSDSRAKAASLATLRRLLRQPQGEGLDHA
jgi:hypothetical protein